MAQVPTIRLAEMSEAQKRAYALADNWLAEAAGWDRELLAVELRYITALELDFDLEVTGFEMAEIDLLLEPSGGEQDILDRLPEADGPPVTAPGDLWCLGRHRMLCADATSAAAFERVWRSRRRSWCSPIGHRTSSSCRARPPWPEKRRSGRTMISAPPSRWRS